MKELRFTAANGSVLVQWAVDHDGAVDFTVKVRVDGFQGHSRGRALPHTWRAFVEGLHALERARQGETRLASIDGGIAFRICSTDSLGHVAAVGSIKHSNSVALPAPEQCLHFELGFDPSQLASALRAVA